MQKRVIGNHWLWQLDSYNKPTLIDDEVADVFQTKLMPCTPQGIYIVTANNAILGDSILEEIVGMTIPEAREYLLKKDGFYLNDKYVIYNE